MNLSARESRERGQSPKDQRQNLMDDSSQNPEDGFVIGQRAYYGYGILVRLNTPTRRRQVFYYSLVRPTRQVDMKPQLPHTDNPPADGELRGQDLPVQDKDDADLSVPVFSLSEVIDKLQQNLNRNGKQPYSAMYSSIFGGITVDPMMMVIPIDDHMVHRGHGVFDTAMIIDGYLYELEAHLDRLLRSASKAKIVSPFDRSSLRNILVQTAAASQCRKGSLRYWLSAGPGNFLLSPSGCRTSAFYAIVIEDDYSPSAKGVKVVTSSIPMKSPQFATMKNVNYLPNALSAMEAEEKGAFTGIWVDDEGYVAEGPNVNVAFISKTDELLVPSFDNILSGCTAKRLLALAPKLVEQGLLKGIRVGNICLEEAKDAAEMMLVGSSLPILPVVAWDDHPIGNGKEGPLALALSSLLWEDMTCGPASSLRIPIPYAKYGHH